MCRAVLIRENWLPTRVLALRPIDWKPAEWRGRGKQTVKYDKLRYKRLNRIEIMFGRLKDRLRVATRYNRCPKVFLFTIALAAIDIYWL